jgi:hypothetical protein
MQRTPVGDPRAEFIDDKPFDRCGIRLVQWQSGPINTGNNIIAGPVGYPNCGRSDVSADGRSTKIRSCSID